MSADTIATTPVHVKRGTIVVLSHLRWDFVFQRPQHLLTRAWVDFDVVFVEEPLHEDAPFGIRDAIRPPGIRLVQPVVPWGSDETAIRKHQHDVVEGIVSRAAHPVILWFYTPMAMAFARDIPAQAVVFDKMDELSAFAMAPPELIAFEADLMARADVVFTGGASMYEAAQHRHENIHCFPSSIDAAHFAAARAGAGEEPDDQAGIAHPRIGFFGVIDERMDVAMIGRVAELRPDWQLVMIGPAAKIDPADLPRGAKPPLAGWQGLQTAPCLPRRLGRRIYAVRDQRRDPLHLAD